MIHQWSPRARAPFIVLSAAMMSPERVEEELFGTEAEGVMRPGLLEHAHGGTLFLDEIADMPLTTQGKMLNHLLQDKGLTPGDLTAILPKSRVSEILNGKRNISKSQAKALAQLLRVPADLFL